MRTLFQSDVPEIAEFKAKKSKKDRKIEVE